MSEIAFGFRNIQFWFKCAGIFFCINSKQLLILFNSMCCGPFECKLNVRNNCMQYANAIVKFATNRTLKYCPVIAIVALRALFPIRFRSDNQQSWKGRNYGRTEKPYSASISFISIINQFSIAIIKLMNRFRTFNNVFLVCDPWCCCIYCAFPFVRSLSNERVWLYHLRRMLQTEKFIESPAEKSSIKKTHPFNSFNWITLFWRFECFDFQSFL